MKIQKLFLLVMILSFAIWGCSKGGSDPISGTNSPPVYEQNPIESFDSLPVIEFDGAGAIGLFGAYNLLVDPENLSAELVPIRTTQIGESFIVSGKSYFATQPCVNCLRIERVALTSTGDVALGFWIKHPFPPGDPSQPPSGRNRRDLDIFDVAALVHPLDKTPANYPLHQTNLFADSVLNADGYTKEMAEVIGNDSALPYLVCYKRMTKNRFAMGTPDEYFYMVLSKTGLSFNIYLTFGYGASATLLDRLEPEYYIPEFNRKSAWKVNVQGATWYGSDPTQIKIDIFDWNHGAPIAASFPDPSRPHHIAASSDIAAVTVEVPGMTSAPVIATTTDTSTNGWDDPITYFADFINENSILEGEYTGIVKVLDSRTTGEVGESDSLVHTPNGISLEHYTMSEYATYQTFVATIAPPCGPITGEVLSHVCPITNVLDGSFFDFTVTASSDNSGDPITTYEIDWNYDGVDFNVMDSNTNGVFTEIGPFENPNCPDTTPEIYTVAFRASDSCYRPNTTVFATCEVIVDNCCGPITGEIESPTCPVFGVANNSTLHFLVNAESEDGGDPIVLYEADYAYDGITFNAMDSNTDGNFENAGPFRNPNCPGTGDPATVVAAFRAIDSCDPPNATIFANCEVTVDICAGWTLSWGGSGIDEASIVKTDSNGNIYVAGYFSETVDLNPTMGIDEHTSNGSSDVFLIKHNSLGVFEWALSWGGEGPDAPMDMVIDSSNNIFITGYYSGTCDFDPGSGSDIQTSNLNTTDVFVSKFNSDGIFQWAKTWGGESDMTGNAGCALALSPAGDIYVGGWYEGTCDFDPGAGSTIRTSAFLADLFINKLNSAGEHQWVITMGAWGYDEVRAMRVDSNGDLIVTGGFFASFDFDPGAGTNTLTSQGDYDVFLAKYDSNGDHIWAYSFGGPVGDMALSMALGPSDSVYLTGFFHETVDFDPDTGNTVERSSNGGKDIFLAWFDTDGSLNDVVTWGGSGNDQGNNITIRNDEILIVGYFSGTNVDFDPGADSDMHSSNGGLDAFMSKLEASTLDFVEARTWGGLLDDLARGVAFDEADNYLIVGGFRDLVDFDPSQYTDIRESEGENDAYLTNMAR